MNLHQTPNYTDIRTFKEYLESPWTFREYSLSTKNNLSFCWIDAGFTTEFVRQLIFNDQSELKKFNTKHQMLKNTIVWVRNKSEVVQYTLFSLYKFLIVNGYSPANDEFEISFLSPLGPYKREELKHFINSKIYHEVIVELLLQKELRERDFRFRVDGVVKFSFDESKEFFYLNVNQISHNGILFSTKDDLFKSKLTNFKKLNFYFDTSLFYETSKMSLDELSQSFSNYPFKLFLTHDQSYHHAIETQDIRTTYQFDSHSNFTNFIHMPFKKITSTNKLAEGNLVKFANNLKHNLEIEMKKNQPLFLVK